MAQRRKIDWAIDFYRALADHENTAEEGGCLVFRGHTTKVVSDVGAPPPYYGELRQMLIELGCIETFERGGATGVSVWRLLKEPTKEEWLAKAIPSKTYGVQTKTTLINHDDRIQRLEVQIAELKRVIADLRKQEAI